MRRDETLLERAREMRAAPTPAEQAPWFALRARRFDGGKFSRQVLVGPYIADFMARREKLIVELDGHVHGETQDHDARRTAWLEAHGYRVIRFANRDVMTNLDGVLTSIAGALRTPPLPGPLPKGEREQE